MAGHRRPDPAAPAWIQALALMPRSPGGMPCALHRALTCAR